VETHTTQPYCRYIVNIGNKTIVFEKENDPTILRSPTAGKLVTFLVDEGGRVTANQPYAEIEVMKMIMSLTAVESGIVHYSKRAGAVLSAGTVIGHLTLENPDQVQLVRSNNYNHQLFAMF
jgi:acetyl-CoA carboxylase/biotin carboxylase 1